MAGNKIGGAKAAATMKAKYGEDFYKRIGAKGGKNGNTGGFFARRDIARSAGKKGGTISRRGPAKDFWLEDAIAEREKSRWSLRRVIRKWD